MDREPIVLFVTGGVISSLGKGIAASALGFLLERQGYKVAMMKLDPYLNIDPGTMSPYQHGEVYVTDDGAEADLDLGHYSRFTSSPLSKLSTITSGQIYDEVLKKERRGEFLGATVQVIPHVTEEIKKRFKACAEQLNGFGFVIAEIGGTVGDIESQPFLEAIRQFRYEKGFKCLNVHVTYVPFIKAAGEVKTKPTQHSVQALRQIGIFPDFIFCRSETPIGEEEKSKIRLFCNVGEHSVFDLPDVNLIYDVPKVLHEQNVEGAILRRFGLEEKEVDLSDWIDCTRNQNPEKHTVRVAVVGKYIKHQDAYKSLYESLYHAACKINVDLKIEKVDPEKIDEAELRKLCKNVDGCLVPGGFGIRGWEGKIATATFCRKEKIPYFGICLGMQVLCVEFAREVLHLKDADSTEFNLDTPHPIVSLLNEQLEVENLGGTMRLGSFPCNLNKKSLAFKAYKTPLIHERHRHRYEFNPKYTEMFLKNGAQITGTNAGNTLCEIMEITDHPWMVGVQFHPEFLSKPTHPHPLFVSFLEAAYKQMLAKKN